MTIWCLGSLNIDYIYQVPHFPQPGETLAATNYRVMPGGKGLNQSIAAARAGAQLRHIGAVGSDGVWLRERLETEGINADQVTIVETATGHAIVQVADDGENAITVFHGANHSLPAPQEHIFHDASPGDWLLLQNETNRQTDYVTRAITHDMQIAYCAAPFETNAVTAVLPFVDLLILNAIELTQLANATGLSVHDLNVPTVIVTKGAHGCTLHTRTACVDTPAVSTHAVDTTGAGDVFTGYLLAGLADKLSIETAIERAQHAAAIMVTRVGTADVIPNLAELPITNT